MSSVKRRCKRVVATARSNMGYSFAYQCPVSENDRKREGKTLVISNGGKTVAVDGFGIRVLKKLLKDCGEIGNTVNPKRSKVVVLEPERRRHHQG